MSALAAFIVFNQQTTPVDPMRLPIGPRMEIRAELNQLTSARDGKPSTAEDIAKAADGQPYVFLGENHATKPHQQLQADVIKALVARGRRVVIGLEMYTRPKQDWLDQWSGGGLGEEEFLEKSEWKTQWGFPFEFYRPVFLAAKESKLPMVALNVPRDWVRQVGRKGLAGLTTEQKLQLPKEIFLGNGAHKMVFNGLMGGHPMTGPQGDNIYSAQVLWDEGMADTAIKWMERFGDDKTVFVVIAGAGHIMYRQGINYRIERRTKKRGVTVVMSQAKEASMVARGIGDFVFITSEGAK
ncbi:MAG: ChaN family lipoprotein [Chlorobia bacterium]|nr:ChaN family lipoprotein [Fimbriimonadaceae bacterium]